MFKFGIFLKSFTLRVISIEPVEIAVAAIALSGVPTPKRDLIVPANLAILESRGMTVIVFKIFSIDFSKNHSK